MSEYIAKEGERLDQIVYAVYGTLDVYNEVLKANIHLADKIELDAGDIVYLPEIKTDVETKDEKVLW
ncbi:tail protein X [Hydrogenimonas thermophila]|uniref:tail protein X n=1 Tax=Hydrogenimonas thermophila TaxID=223786 RepID=UPI0029370F4C|nr:tail protein X [Hydrogenimonas thermophila]WOE69077.1 tail protein X [Hydrogenimonas thermophila]WOE71587.1 tail protein X [Hydrogenimonas thermophila]